MEKAVKAVAGVYQFILRFKDMDEKCSAVDDLFGQLYTRVVEMKECLSEMERREPDKKLKKVVEVYLEHVTQYIEETYNVPKKYDAISWKLKRMQLVLQIEQRLRQGKELLRKADQYEAEGLFYDDIHKRGERLLVGELMGNTARGHLNSLREWITQGANCIGIYGPPGAGKTNLMKHLYNQVYDDLAHYKAVFWATAPNDPALVAGSGSGSGSGYGSSSSLDLQTCVAKAMWFDLNHDNDEVRRAALLAQRFRDMAGTGHGHGHVILFLDNVTRDFPAYDLLGFPTSAQAQAQGQRYILVLSAPSKDICNKMRCTLQLKMDLLPENEAHELFLHEAGLLNNHRQLENLSREVVCSVAKQCNRMPLAIILIARSMIGVEDIREWRNRLEEMMGNVTKIHDEEAKIVNQLKFSYDCLKDTTTQRCFLACARLLQLAEHQHYNPVRLPKQVIINNWIMHGLIISEGNYPQLGDVHDLGNTILNRLERMCLLEVVVRDGRDLVRMNNWIIKMANTITNSP